MKDGDPIEFAHFNGAFGYTGTIDGEAVRGSIQWRSMDGERGSDMIDIDSAVFVHGPQKGGGSNPIRVNIEFASKLAKNDADAKETFLKRLLRECRGLRKHSLQCA